MDKLAEHISGASKTRSANDDDFVDRLSSRYTVVLLVVFAVLVSMNQYVRNPITCWAPVHFTGAHTKYTTDYCWVKNTYYLPWENEIPRQEGNELRQMIPYYQWIPFILLGQAVLFYLPSLVWHALNSKAGVDSDNIMQTVHTMMLVENGETYDDLQLLMTNLIDRFLVNRRVRRDVSRCNPRNLLTAVCHRIFSRRSGVYLLILFLFSKLCYIANVIGQLFVLNHVLATKYHTFGYDLLRDVVASNDWTEESYVAFPRVTLCDFKIRGQDLGNTQTYTVQCVLPINLYNEKIYLFLWFWMLLVAFLSIVAFVVWLVRAVFVSDQIKFVRNHLLVGRQLQQQQQRGEVSADMVERFTVKYLRQDGAFLLRLIAHNTSNVMTTEVVCALWNFWREKEKIAKDEDSRRDSYPDPNSETLGLRKSVE